jgi:hypothetical protein
MMQLQLIYFLSNVQFLAEVRYK